MDDHHPTPHSQLSRQYLAMAFSSSLPSPPKPSATMSVPQLLTPEEPMLDSFDGKPVLPPMHAVPSPPESPAFHSYHAGTSESDYAQHDRILYPDLRHLSTAPADRPLFDSNPSYRWRSRSPDRHRSSAPGSLLSSPQSRCDSPFSHDDKPVARAQSTTSSPLVDAAEPIGPVALYNRWGADYYRLMMSQMEDHRMRMSHRRLPPVNASRAPDRDRYTQQQVSLLDRGRSTRIEKPRPVAKPTPKLKAAAKATPSPKLDAPAKRSRRQAASPEMPTAVGTWQQSPAPKARTRAAPSKKVDDKDYSEWASIEDFSPPTDSLDQMGKKLTATWNNSNSLNLENDPDRQQLHPQEYEIASTLRLKCNQYLASKRRIFGAKVKALKEGREFNKTSAQNCCTIDVNKASRLWMAFDAVGWFDDHWFQESV